MALEFIFILITLRKMIPLVISWLLVVILQKRIFLSSSFLESVGSVELNSITTFPEVAEATARAKQSFLFGGLMP